MGKQFAIRVGSIALAYRLTDKADAIHPGYSLTLQPPSRWREGWCLSQNWIQRLPLALPNPVHCLYKEEDTGFSGVFSVWYSVGLPTARLLGGGGRWVRPSQWHGLCLCGVDCVEGDKDTDQRSVGKSRTTTVIDGTSRVIQCKENVC